MTALGVGAAVLWGVPGDLSSIFVGVSADHKPEFVAAKHIPVSLNARPPPHFSGPPPLPHLPILPLVMGSLVSILFAALMAWYMARPIRSLKRALTEIAAGHLSARVGNTMGDRKDELVDLGGQFDHMADRLEHLLESQHRLLHDVSHELRSPLTRLQMATDLLRQQPERSEELIERIQRDTARMDDLGC